MNTIRLIPHGGDLATVLAFMQRNGSSVVLNYGEDTGLWECSWITGGERITTVYADPSRAARECIAKVGIYETEETDQG